MDSQSIGSGCFEVKKQGNRYKHFYIIYTGVIG